MKKLKAFWNGLTMGPLPGGTGMLKEIWNGMMWRPLYTSAKVPKDATRPGDLKEMNNKTYQFSGSKKEWVLLNPEQGTYKSIVTALEKTMLTNK